MLTKLSDSVKYLLPILLIIALVDVDFHIGYPIMDAQFYVVFIFMALGLLFGPIVRFSFIGVGCAIAYMYPDMLYYPTRYEEMVGWIGPPVILAIIYACYKTNGISFTCVFLTFLALPIIGVGVPASLSPIVVDSNAMLGIPIHIMTGIVFLFILLGKILLHTGIVDRVVGFIVIRVNNPARIAIISSAIFGSISGSAVSNVMSTGQLTIPMMIRSGYTKTRAAAYEAVASTGGCLMPPIMGAAAFIMAEMLMVSYWKVALVATLPSIVFYAILLLGVPKIRARDSARDTETQNLNSVYPLRLPSWKPFLLDISKDMRDLIFLAAAVGIIIGVLDQTGLAFTLSNTMIEAAGDNKIFLLLLVASICIVLGMGMPTVPTYLIVSVIAAPALIQSGFEPIYAHLFVLYFGVLAMITPPVAIASFAAAKLSKAEPMSVALDCMRIGWPLFLLPFIFVWF